MWRDTAAVVIAVAVSFRVIGVKKVAMKALKKIKSKNRKIDVTQSGIL